MPAYGTTLLDKATSLRDDLFKTYATGKTKDVAFRKEQLMRLIALLKENEEHIQDAAAVDLGPHVNETGSMEYVTVVTQALDAYANVDAWASPEEVTTTSGRSSAHREPKGVVLVVGSYKYPLFCLAVPLIGAISAGCAVLIVPSELSPRTATLWAQLLPKYLDETAYVVANSAASEFLGLQWDHIFFTGSEHEGKLVAVEAAKHLTPITLEIEPTAVAVVDKDCDFDAAAQSVLWAKFTNAGQAYAAPDYIIVLNEAHEKLLDALTDAYRQFAPVTPSEVSQIAYPAHEEKFERLRDRLSRTRGNIVLGGNIDPCQQWISTTVVDRCMCDDALFEDGFLGPVLPVVTVKSIDDAIQHIGTQRSTMCCIFSNSRACIDNIFACTTSGTVVANECIMEPGIAWTSLGGNGCSWDSAKSGKIAFDTFSQVRKSIQFPPEHSKSATLRHPPYTAEKAMQLRQALHRRLAAVREGPIEQVGRPWGKFAAAMSLAVVVTVAILFPQQRDRIFGAR